MTMQSASEKAAFWELDLENEKQPVPLPLSVQPCICTSEIVDIGILEEQQDLQMPIKEADIRPGGKYHSILKLFFWFEASELWTTATGWLLKDDLVVTATHCVYNNNQRATRVKAYISYSAILKPTEISAGEQRFVKRIALPLKWINVETEQNDVAFL
ncbi:hypothetical protein MMC06_003475 [Schaereria dolodes]|nr:hypothetical protein [Schaereria dolodes]